MGGRRLPRVCPRFRRGSTRRRPMRTPVAPGPDQRTRSPLLLGPRHRHIGFELLAQARQEYAAWGATAKVAQLDSAHPSAAATPRHGGGAAERPVSDDSLGSGSVSTRTIDLMGILSASQALSSQTTIAGLHARVAEVLGAMTGATSVALLLWSDDRRDWLLQRQPPEVAPPRATQLPMSVLRYPERTPEPLVVADAISDDRFARDPYFADVDRCSLLALPILSRGRLRALLLLENRLIRGAFTAERLDAVNLIAGQFAVSLDNAQLYSELTASRTRIVAASDQTRRQIERDLHDGAQQRLVSLILELWYGAGRGVGGGQASFGCNLAISASRHARHSGNCVICRAESTRRFSPRAVLVKRCGR